MSNFCITLMNRISEYLLFIDFVISRLKMFLKLLLMDENILEFPDVFIYLF